MNTDYDYIIVGSGAGGSAAAYRLAQGGGRVLLLEKGPELPRDGSTLDVEKVIREGTFKSREIWLDGKGADFAPEEYFNVGGKTKWYGAALLRFDPRELAAEPAGGYLPWPVGYQELEPYYEEAERLLGVRIFDPEPGLSAIVERLARKSPGWRSEPLPLALAPQILEHPEEARHFDAFASVLGLKHEAETAFLEPARRYPGLEVRTGQPVAALLSDPARPERVAGVKTVNGQVFRAKTVLLAAGALHSPRLLQSYLEASGLAERLPCAPMVGRNYKQHLLTAVVAFTPRRQTDLLRKTLVLLNDAVPHSSVQPLGFDGELIGALMPAVVPRALAKALGQYAYGLFLQTEDGSDERNRVLAGAPGQKAQLDYDPRRCAPAFAEHRRLVRGLLGALWRCGYPAFAKPIPLGGTAHACGSLVAGDAPLTSVVDARGRVHGMDNLYVVDGSVLPRSSRVNPSLTIYAWALRVAQLLESRPAETDREVDLEPSAA